MIIASQTKDTALALAQADQAVRAGNFAAAEALLAQIAGQGAADFTVLVRLAVVRRQRGDYTGAIDVLERALAVRPQDFPALLMKGSLLRAFGRREEAARAYAEALAFAPPAASLPPQMLAELEHAKASVASDAAWRERLGAMQLGQPRLRALRDAILVGSEGPLLLDGMDSVGFYEPHDFPGVTEFAAATPDILTEFQTLVAARAPELVDMAAHGKVGAGAGKWSAIHLISDGERVEENAAFAPLSIRLYEALDPPRIAGRSPNLMFSLLDPGAHIPPHHGIINTRLVIHIPLIVPDNCALRVGAETRRWEPGTALVFDDTIEHEAWNKSDRLRVVLLGDLWRPELDEPERRAVADLMARG